MRRGLFLGALVLTCCAAAVGLWVGLRDSPAPRQASITVTQEQDETQQAFDQRVKAETVDACGQHGRRGLTRVTTTAVFLDGRSQTESRNCYTYP